MKKTPMQIHLDTLNQIYESHLYAVEEKPTESMGLMIADAELYLKKETQDIKRKNEIMSEVYDAVLSLGGKSDLLGIIGSYGDTMSDADVLQALKSYNQKLEK